MNADVIPDDVIPDDLVPELLRVIPLSIVQVAVFVVLYEAAVELYVQYIGPMNKIFGFGTQVNHGLYLLSILACLNAIAQVFASRIRIRFLAAASAAIVWIFYWGNIADVVPNRVVMLSALGMVSLATGVLFMFPKIEVRVGLR